MTSCNTLPLACSPMQKETLLVLRDMAGTSTPPTMEELAKRLGVARPSAYWRLYKVAGLRFVTRAEGGHYRITPRGEAALALVDKAHCAWCAEPQRADLLQRLARAPADVVAAEVAATEAFVKAFRARAKQRGCMGPTTRACLGGCGVLVVVSRTKRCPECKAARKLQPPPPRPDVTCVRPGCGNTFPAKPWVRKRYCSRVCADIVRGKRIKLGKLRADAPGFVIRLRAETPADECIFCPEKLTGMQKVTCEARECINAYDVEYKKERKARAEGRDPRAEARQELEEASPPWVEEALDYFREAAIRREYILGNCWRLRQRVAAELGLAA